MTILAQLPNKYLPTSEREDRPRPEKRLLVRVKYRPGGYSTVAARRRWSPTQINDQGYALDKHGHEVHEIYASELPELQRKVEGHLEEQERLRFQKQYETRLRRHMAEKLSIPEAEIDQKIPLDRDKWTDAMRSIEAQYTGSPATEQYQATFTGHRPFAALEIVGEKPSVYDELEDSERDKQKAALSEIAQVIAAAQSGTGSSEALSMIAALLEKQDRRLEALEKQPQQQRK